MGTKSPGAPQRCRLVLKQCLAVQLSKPGHTLDDFWMYDSGYMIFQNFLSANAQCWWNAPLTAATRALKYAGHVAPGLLLVSGEPCALEVVRGAFARSVLKPPATYVISSVGDIDDCIVTPIMQGQFTPLPEALCDVIMDLTAEGHSATIENIRTRIEHRFFHMTPPSIEVIYDSLAQLMQEQKIYQTAKGYFILTPERRRSRSRPRSHHNGYMDLDKSTENVTQESRTMLMTNAEALHSLYGEISTERDGDLTHQCIQTNLADVICGGNPNDKILFPRTSKRRSSSFPTPRSLERRHSLRLFGSSKRLQRCVSTRSLSKTYAQTLNTDSSSSEYQSTDSSSPKKGSLLSRLFRRSGRNKARQLESYSAQFPPAEWFNSKAVHLHSVGTQTQDHDMPTIHTLSNSTFYDGSELSQRSLTLPRRHHRNLSSESTFLISSRDCSPIRRRSPAYSSSSLPRSTHSIPVSANTNNAAQKSTHSSNTLSVRTSTPNRSSQKSIQSGSVPRHMLEHSPSRSINSSQKSTVSTGRSQETRNEYRMWQSGPSSLESGKSSLYPSGPSSIDSAKVSSSRTSGHSSLDSHRSTSSTVIQPRSIIMLNGSPRGTPRHQILRARNAEQAMRNQSSTTSSIQMPISAVKILPDNTTDTSNSDNNKSCSAISNSTSNNSITLKLTTSNDGQHNLPSTKIVVQNSPAHSMITFENSQLTENSNVFIINNETTTNERGEVLRKTLSKQQMTGVKNQTARLDNDNHRSEISNQSNPIEIGCNRDSDGDTFNSMHSYVSQIFNDKLNEHNEVPKLSNSQFSDSLTTMNNSRNKGLPIPPTNFGHLIYKNNVLKNSDCQPHSPSEDKTLPGVEVLTIPNVEITGSVGNLRFYEKNSKDTLAKAINSNCELNNLRYESSTLLAKNDNLNSNTSLSGGSLVHILQKNSISLGSEPNLAQKDTNCTASSEKSIRKDTLDRRLSLSKDEAEDLFNFPSLTDLSFNFTSLAAQRILQGVSLNSIDTLVELNMAAAAAAAAASNTTNASAMEKPQNNQPTSICTDYGLV